MRESESMNGNLIYRFRWLICGLVLGLLLGGTPLRADVTAGYEITRSTFGASSGMSGGEYELTATAGQPAAGETNGGAEMVASGFWPAAYESIFINWLPLVVR